MPSKSTGRQAAKAASKVLSSPKSTTLQKRAAASALGQVERRGKG